MRSREFGLSNVGEQESEAVDGGGLDSHNTPSLKYKAAVDSKKENKKSLKVRPAEVVVLILRARAKEVFFL